MSAPTVSRRYAIPVNRPAPMVGVRVPTVEERCAQILDCTEPKFSADLLKSKDIGELFVREALEAGKPERALWYTGCMIEMLETGIRPGCFKSAMVEQQSRDASEDVAEAELLAAMTPEAWKAYKRKLHLAYAASLAFLAAGDKHFGLSA